MDPWRQRRISFGGLGGSGGPPPRDLVALLAVVFATFSLQFFAATAPLIELLRLTPAVWQRGFVWQIVTYPFAGSGPPSVWILLELAILFWFGRDVYRRLGRKQFWLLLAWAALGAALAAVTVELVRVLLGFGHPRPFLLMQGQRMLLAVLIAAFASLYRDATILLMFVIPVKARWFVALEILFAFIAFLGSGDLAGFVGIAAAVGIAWSLLTRGSLKRAGREVWLRLQQRWLRYRLDRERRRRGFRVIDGGGQGGGGRGDGGQGGGRGDGPRDPWVN